MGVSIRAKFKIGVFIVCLLVLMLGAVSLVTQSRLNHQLQFLTQEATKLHLVSTLELAAYKSVMPGNDYIITGSSSYKNHFEEQDKRVKAIFAQIDAFPLFVPAERAVIAQVHELYDKTRGTTLTIMALPYGDPALPKMMEEMDYQYAEPLLAQLTALGDQITASYKKNQAEAAGLKRLSQNVLVAVVVAVSLLLAVGGRFLFNSIMRPLRSVGDMLNDIASGRGDLTKRLPVQTDDEVGSFCLAFNRFAENLQGTITDISVVSGHLATTAGTLEGASQQIRNTAEHQAEAVEETVTANEKLDAAIRSITCDTEEVVASMVNISSSAGEISATMQDIAGKTHHLDAKADQTTEAMLKNLTSFQVVADNVASVTSRAEEVAASALQVSAVAKEINGRSEAQAELARAVKEEAVVVGLAAICQTKDGMGRIRTEVSATIKAMDELVPVSEEVGRVVKIINDISDRTKLLALNASILAAQAGEHGRGFAVVAEEVRLLAQQVTGSTNDIADMVQAIQRLTSSAVTATRRSAAEVDAGVVDSQAAETALRGIILRTEQSLDNALVIARSAKEQTTGIGMVSDAMQHVSAMANEINQNTVQQREISEGIITATGEMRDLIRSMKEMVSVQAEESDKISQSIMETLVSLKTVAGATSEQESASDRIIEIIEEVRRQAIANMTVAKSLDERVSELNDHSHSLSERVGVFTV
ncbi:methyl-accepting chemotaxis protein [Citrifermentans bremense]|uniref:methyl-accepting chemotaxis protein n=1 Tax=Citrifermentans bremense TaxID=60035 RepID=UPI0004035AD8|nr:HAMP domain-containing methyl-accepting chemotaxis protein [Citrifermentans bremense]